MRRFVPIAIALVLGIALLEADAARVIALVWAVVAGGTLAAAWLASAWGLGARLRLDRATLAAGVTLLLLVDGMAGRLGLLDGRGLGIALLVPGWALALGRLRGRPRRLNLEGLGWSAPALVVLVLAAASAPGWLWTTEFAGYDALSYHLALPREWLAAGRLQGLEHNVYAYFPSALEAAYLHLFAIAPDDASAALGAQFLHAGLALGAAWTCAHLAQERLGRAAGVLAGALVIGTPWTLVTGTLAYNEMGGVLALAGGLTLLARDDVRVREAVTVGLLAGTAAACKLTNAGFVALPLLALLVARARRGPTIAIAVAAAAVPLVPWLTANALATGNPVFPFLRALGTGHWTTEQAAIWAQGHAPPGGLPARLTQAWNQFARLGIGPNPDPAEPWRAQWLVLPWLALAGAAMAMRPPDRRAPVLALVAVVALQLLLWITLTHVRSRFMMPAVVPMALLAAMAWPHGPIVLARAIAIAWCAGAAALFAFEGHGHPTLGIGTEDVRTGRAHAELLEAHPDERAAIWMEAPATYWVNEALDDNVRVLLLGEARSFYFDLDRIRYQTTWDRGPWSAVMSADPDDDTAWVPALRERGFTHALVDPDMLEIWDRAGWNDPRLTADRVVDVLEREATLMQVVRGRERLYWLGPLDQPPGPPK